MTFVAVFAASLIVPDALDFGCVSFHNPHKTTPYVPGFSGLSRLPSLPPPLQGGSKETRPSMFPVLLTYMSVPPPSPGLLSLRDDNVKQMKVRTQGKGNDSIAATTTTTTTSGLCFIALATRNGKCTHCSPQTATRNHPIAVLKPLHVSTRQVSFASQPILNFCSLHSMIDHV